jgi:integrase
MPARLTETFVKRVKAPATGYVIYSDGEIDGFGLRVTAAGQRSFVLSYRPLPGSKQRRYTIGKYPDDYSATTARFKAVELRQGIREGQDPFLEQQRRMREAVEEQARAKTIKQLSDAFLNLHVRHLRPKTQSEYRAILNNHVLPSIGNIRANTVSRGDIAGIHSALRATPYLANRVLAVVSAMFGWAKAHDGTQEQNWGVTENPAERLSRCHEEQRERWLTPEEMERFAAALEEYPEKHTAALECSEKQRVHMKDEAKRICDAIRLVMVTGSRKSEVLCATWSEFDLKRAIWRKPSHHTKQKRQQHLPLSEDGVLLLQSITRNGNDLVFPGRMSNEPFKDIKGAWGEICKLAKIKNLRIHDLRHNYASYLVSNGVSLQVVGKLLGHTQPQTTWRYAHVADHALREATNRFSHLIGKSKAETA